MDNVRLEEASQSTGQRLEGEHSTLARFKPLLVLSSCTETINDVILLD